MLEGGGLVDAPDPRRWLMLPVVLSATFMYGFDLNVVNVAIPSLQHDLHAGQAALELVVGGYSFTYAAGLVIGGRLGDIFSYRRMFLVGMTAFAVASVLCAVSRNPVELVAARVVQGLTAAMMVPQVLALVTSVFTAPHERARALSWFGVVAGLAGVFGQVLGGFLISANVLGLSWRVIFLLNLPVGAVVLGFAVWLLPKAGPGRRPRLDFVGVLSVSGALALALLPIIFGRTTGWSAWTWACLAAAVPALAGALWWERRLASRGGKPLLDLTLFHNRSFSLGLAVNVVFMAAFTSFIFVMSLLLQSGLGLTPLRAGLAFGPMAVTGMAGPLVGRRLIVRTGPGPVLLLGAGFSALGVVVIATALQLQGGGVALGWLVAGLAVGGFGNTLILPAAIGSTLGGVRRDQAGVASGMLNTTQQFAGTSGLAVIATVFFSVLGVQLGRPHFAHAAEDVAWIELGLFATLAALAVVTTRLTAAAAKPPAVPAAAPAQAAPADETRAG